MQHLLKLLDLSSKEIEELINLADQLKYERKHGISHALLDGVAMAMIFQKPSLRTRMALELGMQELGGSAVYLPSELIAPARGEAPEDVARTISRFCDVAAVRAYDQEEVEDLAHYGTIPVINAQSDTFDPLLALTDLMTIRESKGRLDGLKAAFVGDGASAMNSVIVGCLKMRMNVAVACPEGYDPDDRVLDYAAQVGHFEMYRDPRGAARAADVVITDTWMPVGRESEYTKRQQDFRGFTLGNDVMNYAKPDALVLHGMPAQRDAEITSELLEAHSAEIFEAAENRLYVIKAVLVALLNANV